MTEDDIERVAQLVATFGGSSYPERTRPALRAISMRHRDVARLILGALDRTEEEQGTPADTTASEGLRGDKPFNFTEKDQLYVGATVAYRSPGDKRAVTCRIEKMERGRAYLVPAQQEIGWVSTQTLSPTEP